MPMPPLQDSKLRDLPTPLLRRWLRLPPDHGALLVKHPGSADLLLRLGERRLFAEAARLLAYALPEREAVWWACMCVEDTGDTSSAGRQAVEAAEAWVRRADEHTRREAAWAAAAAGYATPGAWAALGAYWAHRTPFTPALCGGRGAEMVIARITARDDPASAAERLRRFIIAGMDIAAGGAGRPRKDVER